MRVALGISYNGQPTPFVPPDNDSCGDKQESRDRKDRGKELLRKTQVWEYGYPDPERYDYAIFAHREIIHRRAR